ncbi:MAG: hypothetical protein JXM70_19610 [Pirellulales bacterium]|nr:hypothetical protein [Pirellulales bacterium]
MRECRQRLVCVILLIFGLSVFLPAFARAQSPRRLGKIEPTILCPRKKSDEVPVRFVDVEIINDADTSPLSLRVTAADEERISVDLGEVEQCKIVKRIALPDLNKAAKTVFQLLSPSAITPVDIQTVTIEPVKQWKVYCISYSHHDLGYSDFYHKIQRDIRLGSIERALTYCRETDSWDSDSQFRWLMETSVPITEAIEQMPPAIVDEMIRRVREGRIEWGACHNTASPEMMGTELVSRLFYTPNRHGRDLLGIDFSPVGVISDVVGLPMGFGTFTKEADLPYFYFSPNRLARCMEPAMNAPFFYLQSPDGDSRRTLFRAAEYDFPHPECLPDFKPETVLKFIASRANNSDYNVNCVVALDTNDFTVPSMDYAKNIRKWNEQWRNPKMICATMKMFFEDVASQIDTSKVPAFTKDAASAWSDQELADSWLLGQARTLTPKLTAAETFSTIASKLDGRGYPWLDLWQAYNRLLMYHEHTNGADAGYPRAVGTGKDNYPEYYEGEQSMHRALIEESQAYCDRAAESTFSKLVQLITTTQNTTLIVFNPLTRRRTDIVRADMSSLSGPFHLVETCTGKEVPIQKLEDGSVLFLAKDIPQVGYKTYAVKAGEISPEISPEVTVDSNILENKYYRIVFDESTGGIVSIRDKELNVELVDNKAVHRFNEYLYQHSAKECGKLEWRNKKSAILKGSAGTVRGRMVAEVNAPGCKGLRQTVALYTDLKRIDFLQELDKSPSGITLPQYQRYDWNGREAVYFAMPFNVPDFCIRHDVPGAVIEPIIDQFPGSSTSYYAVQHFTDISNKDYGVTVAPRESPVIEYGRPRPATWLMGDKAKQMGDGYTMFESKLENPKQSHLYFYVMNNFFPVNARCDQRGPSALSWSLRSHRGDWKEGRAVQFGRDVSNPLIARLARGRKNGTLPKDQYSFFSIDRPNVVCTTIKMAEANGSGIILRLNEVEGQGGPVTITCPFFPDMEHAVETNLIEDDRPHKIPIKNGNQLTLEMPPFGIKTIRLLANPDVAPHKVTGLQAEAISDMQVNLKWNADRQTRESLCRYLIYRGKTPDFPLTMRHYVDSTAQSNWIDKPRLDIGGWISSCLLPKTAYYYKIVPLDRNNRRGPPSESVAVRTLSSTQNNRRPEQVQGLHVFQVSPLEKCNFLTLWFYSNIEPDIVGYRIHRSTKPHFSPDENTFIGSIELSKEIQYDTLWGVHMKNRLDEYDRQLFRDETVEPGKTYYYRVCAVDAAGNCGEFSKTAGGRTESVEMARVVQASSQYSNSYPPYLATDNSKEDVQAWVSAPYGGGTKENPREVWIAFELPRKIKIVGIKKIGDERSIIPIQKNYAIQARITDEWQTVKEVRGATSNTNTVIFDEPVETAKLRLHIPVRDLPVSDDPREAGIVRVAELYLILEDKKEYSIPDVWLQQE